MNIDISKNWLVLAFLAAMVILRALNFDTFVTAALSGIAMYILGYDISANAMDNKNNQLKTALAELQVVKDNIRNGLRVTVDTDDNFIFT